MTAIQLMWACGFNAGLAKSFSFRFLVGHSKKFINADNSEVFKNCEVQSLNV